MGKRKRGMERGGVGEARYFSSPFVAFFTSLAPSLLTPVTQATPFEHVQVCISQATPQHFVLSGSGTHL